MKNTAILPRYLFHYFFLQLICYSFYLYEVYSKSAYFSFGEQLCSSSHVDSFLNSRPNQKNIDSCIADPDSLVLFSVSTSSPGHSLLDLFSVPRVLSF